MFDFYSDTIATELALLGMAFFLSAVIGVERQRKLKSAGLRTHSLVGLGSAVFTLVSAYGFSNVVGPEVLLDPSRISAQIVSGIGFLGAGVIFVRKGSVSGLTTAASIWGTAAIGMACGAGMPIIAIAATLLHLFTVGVLTHVGRKIRPESQPPTLSIRYRRGNGALRQILETAALLGYESSFEDAPTDIDRGSRELNLRFLGAPRDFPALVGRLSQIEGIESVTTHDDPDE